MSASQSLAERFRGSMPALVTPFKNGDVDEDAFGAGSGDGWCRVE